MPNTRNVDFSVRAPMTNANIMQKLKSTHGDLTPRRQVGLGHCCHRSEDSTAFGCVMPTVTSSNTSAITH
jgi:hypothetical protein